VLGGLGAGVRFPNPLLLLLIIIASTQLSHILSSLIIFFHISRASLLPLLFDHAWCVISVAPLFLAAFTKA
jgi:hypothetical protein